MKTKTAKRDGVVHLAHKIELRPTPHQIAMFAQACEVASASYNWALAQWRQQYADGGKPNEMALRRELNAIKREQYPSMLAAPCFVPEQAIMALGGAFDRFFKTKTGYPKFKKREQCRAFCAARGPSIRLDGKAVVLPKFGRVRMRETLRWPDGRVLRCVVSRVADKWFASFTVEVEHTPPVRAPDPVVGVDLGLKTLATMSDGTRAENPKALALNLKRLARLQRSVSRKKKGSANRRKAVEKVARLHYRIACIRKDAQHNLTSRLAKEYGTVKIEDLNVKGMVRSGRGGSKRGLSRGVSDAAMGEVRRQIEYKAKLYGSRVVVVDRWYASSQLCSECGWRHTGLELRDRTWTCTQCGAVLDRDLNAAKNLERWQPQTEES